MFEVIVSTVASGRVTRQAFSDRISAEAYARHIDETQIVWGTSRRKYRVEVYERKVLRKRRVGVQKPQSKKMQSVV